MVRQLLSWFKKTCLNNSFRAIVPSVNSPATGLSLRLLDEKEDNLVFLIDLCLENRLILMCYISALFYKKAGYDHA